MSGQWRYTTDRKAMRSMFFRGRFEKGALDLKLEYPSLRDLFTTEPIEIKGLELYVIVTINDKPLYIYTTYRDGRPFTDL